MKREFDVVDLPEATLEKSHTYRAWKNVGGRCAKCSEYTEVLSPCCGSGVWHEGGTVDADDLWNDIEDEIEEWAQNNQEKGDL